jgi:hypothetical protein
MKTITNIIYAVFALFAFACFALLPTAQAVVPAPDGCYSGFTTAEGCDALHSLAGGAGNTGVGWRSLFFDSTGNFNTGVGAGALVLNNGDSNTAVGTIALLLNTTGSNNTAVGATALYNNSAGDYITALGSGAGTDPGIVRNNLYLGDPGFGGDENVISIGGIAASGTPYDNCYIGGIAPQSQPTDGVTVCEVTVRLADGRLGIDCTHPSNPGSVPDSAPLRRSGPQPSQPQAMRHEFQKQQKRISELENTVARLAATVKEQAAQIQRVSAQLEASRPAPQVVDNQQ